MNLRDDVKAFVDGELDEARAAQVQAAMASDSDLRGDIEAMRALGFELRRTAVEHEVKGAEKGLGRFGRSKKRNWFLEAVACCLILGVVGAITFPVFAQSKESAKRTSERSAAKMAEIDQQNRRSDEVESDSGLAPPATGGRAGYEAPLVKNESRLYSEGDLTKFNDVSRGPSVLAPDLIRTAVLNVLVKDSPSAMTEAMAIAKRMGGYHQNSRSVKAQDQTSISEVTLRVPVDRFDMSLDALRKLGEVTEDSSDSQDVTAEIADVGARLKVLRAEEESYVTMLRAGKKVGEILEIKDRLSSVRQQIESLTAQQKALKDQSAYSTISCTFTERPKVEAEKPSGNWTEDAWANAVNGLKGVGRFLGQAAIFLFVYSPIWLPLVLVGWFYSRRSRAG